MVALIERGSARCHYLKAVDAHRGDLFWCGARTTSSPCSAARAVSSGFLSRVQARTTRCATLFW